MLREFFLSGPTPEVDLRPEMKHLLYTSPTSDVNMEADWIYTSFLMPLFNPGLMGTKKGKRK